MFLTSPADEKGAQQPFYRAVTIVKWILVISTVLGAITLIVQFLLGNSLTEEDIERTVERFGFYGPLVFIAVFAFAGSLIVPTTVLAVIGAALFGDIHGFLYSMAGAQIGAMLGFLAARTLGRNAVEGWIGKHSGRVAQLDKRLVEHGFTTAIVVRLIYLPNGLINIVCGISGIRARTYSVATFLGLLPVVFAVVFVAASAKEAFFHRDLSIFWEPKTVFAFVLYVGSISVPLVAAVVRRKRRLRREGEDTDSAGSAGASP